MIVNRLSRSFSVVVLSAALFWSCASAPTADIRVHSAADTQAKIPAYKTYAWDLNAGVLHDHTGAWVPKDIDTQSEVQFLIDKSCAIAG